MSETFAELFEKSLTETDLRPGALVKATVVEVRPDRVIVNAGLKSEGIIPASEFRNEEPHVGDEFLLSSKPPIMVLVKPVSRAKKRDALKRGASSKRLTKQVRW